MAKRKPRTRAPRTTPSTTVQPVSEPAAASSGGRRADLGTEYHYVIEDLRRIAIIAAVLIAGLVGLSLLL